MTYWIIGVWTAKVMPDFAERQRELQELASLPEVDSALLEESSWEVIGNILYEGSEEDRLLLPATRPLIEKLANYEALDVKSYTRLNANILLGTWGVLSAFANQRPVSEAIRLSSRRRLGGLVSTMTDNNFNLDDLEPLAARKVNEAMTLQLLQRNNADSGVFGLPAPPSMHYFKDINTATDTTAFQLYAFMQRSDRVVPINTRRLSSERIKGSSEPQNVLVVALGNLALSALRSVEPIARQSRAQGGIRRGQQWMTNYAAKLLTLEVDPHSTIPRNERLLKDEARWLDDITRRFAQELQCSLK